MFILFHLDLTLKKIQVLSVKCKYPSLYIKYLKMGGRSLKLSKHDLKKKIKLVTKGPGPPQNNEKQKINPLQNNQQKYVDD